jgi:transcriptional regulator
VTDERYLPRSHRDMVALVDAHPLAWVISRDFQATLLPLLAETDDEGGLRALLGHIPVRNPQRLALERDPDALILFLGPNDYISPRLVSNSQWGPTWNYAALRVRARVEFVEHETDVALRLLAAHLEPGGDWSVERMGPRYERLRQHVVAFRAVVQETDARFKLGQDEQATTFAEITARLPDGALAELMRRQRADEDPA